MYVHCIEEMNITTEDQDLYLLSTNCDKNNLEYKNVISQSLESAVEIKRTTDETDINAIFLSEEFDLPCIKKEVDDEETYSSNKIIFKANDTKSGKTMIKNKKCLCLVSGKKSFKDARNKCLRVTKTSDLESDSQISSIYTKRKTFKEYASEEENTLPQPPPLKRFKYIKPLHENVLQSLNDEVDDYSTCTAEESYNNTDPYDDNMCIDSHYLTVAASDTTDAVQGNQPLFEDVTLGPSDVMASTPTPSISSNSEDTLNDRILRHLQQILKKQNILQGMFLDMLSEMDLLKQQINATSVQNEAVINQSVFTEVECLPISNADNLDTFEKYLNEEANMNKTVAEISKFGGSSIYNFILRVGTKLISNKFAGAEYSFLGRKGKKAFKELKLATLFLKGAEKCFPEATQKDIEQEMAKWLRRCPERGKNEKT